MPARMRRSWSPKETVSRSSRSDLGTSSMARMVPTRTSMASRVEIGMLGLIGEGVMRAILAENEGPRLRGPCCDLLSYELLRLHAPGVGVRPFPLVAEARIHERRGRPRALVVRLVAATVVPGVQVG